jgi:hypothetical protein
MNCIQYSTGRHRYDHRIVDPQEEEYEDFQEFLRAHPCDAEKRKAEEMENFLGNALSMAERSSGSILCLQKMTPMNAIEFGRRMSSLRSMGSNASTRETNLTDGVDMTSSNSFQRSATLPTFLKVEPGNPAILTQKSWETINYSTDSETDDGEVPMHRIKQAFPARTRSWNKLRKTIDKEERASKQPKRSGRLGNVFPSLRRNSNRKKSQSFAKEVPVEVSLQAPKKRSWGGLRRGKEVPKKMELMGDSCVTNPWPLTPTPIPMDLQQEAEEGFFVNGSEESKSALQPDASFMCNDKSFEVSTENEAESMEVMCGLNGNNSFDIISPSNLLKGFETSWKELTEDSFDIVPRRL